MPSPFPGMDPYLESKDLWRGLHARLTTYAAEALQAQLRGTRYFADIEERAWNSEVDRGFYPDVAVSSRSHEPKGPSDGRDTTLQADEPIVVHSSPTEFREGFVEIREKEGHRLVTSLEFVSPTNKSKNDGRRLYLRKQHELSQTVVNLVEVDLLRRGRHVLKVPKTLVEPLRPWDYLVSIWRPGGSDFEIYPMLLRQALPRIRIPLKPEDTDAVLDLQAVFSRSYDAGPYAERIDYAKAAEIPLDAKDAPWAAVVVAAWQNAGQTS